MSHRSPDIVRAWFSSMLLMLVIGVLIGLAVGVIVA